MQHSEEPTLNKDHFKKIADKAFEFRQELSKETDRGLAILSTSYLENRLELLLEKILIGTDKQKKELLNGFGPLSSFSSKIKILYSFGILPKALFQELDRIRAIRNEFAHNPLIISFETKNIKEKCEKLTFVVAYKEMTSRQRFLNSISGVYGNVDGLVSTIDKIKEPKDINLEERNSTYIKLVQSVLSKLNKS